MKIDQQIIFTFKKKQKFFITNRGKFKDINVFLSQKFKKIGTGFEIGLSNST